MRSPGAFQVPFVARFSTQLFGLILLIFIPSLVLLVQSNLKERRARTEQTRDGMIGMAKLAAAKQENFVLNAEQLLRTVTQFDFLVFASDRQFCETHFSNLRKLSPEYLDIGLIEADGTLFCSTITNARRNLSEWSCFKRVSETKTFSIGDFSSDGTTGGDSLDFGFPVFDETGAMKRVLFASLDLARMRQAAARIELPETATLTILDDSGIVLARHPGSTHNGFLGKSMKQDPYVQKLLSGGDTVIEMPGLDGVAKLLASASVVDGTKERLWISVGIPTKTLFANVNQALWNKIFVMAVILMLALAFAYLYAEHFFLNPLNELISGARSLAAGKWKSRSNATKKGAGELSELSRTFEEMALTLEKNREEIERTNADLEQRVKERTFQLEQAGQELEAFSYSVSHDLRAPLRHITGFVDLLSDELGESISKKGRRYLDIIADSAKQMGLLIDDLLVFSKMGRVEMQKTHVNTKQLLDETISNLEPEFKGRNIIWDKAPLPDLQADPAMLRQVFVNLLSNAIKYSQPRDPAKIQIGFEENPQETILFVRDNGVGFDMQYAGKLFGVFQRLHQSDEFEGTGIGLANVRRIIQRHGGRTWAKGKVGEGATFYFSLPKART